MQAPAEQQSHASLVYCLAIELYKHGIWGVYFSGKDLDTLAQALSSPQSWGQFITGREPLQLRVRIIIYERLAVAWAKGVGVTDTSAVIRAGVGTDVEESFPLTDYQHDSLDWALADKPYWRKLVRKDASDDTSDDGELDDGTTIYVDSEAERVQLLNDQLAAVLVAMAHYCHGKVGAPNLLPLCTKVAARTYTDSEHFQRDVDKACEAAATMVSESDAKEALANGLAIGVKCTSVLRRLARLDLKRVSGASSTSPGPADEPESPALDPEFASRLASYPLRMLRMAYHEQVSRAPLKERPPMSRTTVPSSVLSLPEHLPACIAVPPPLYQPTVREPVTSLKPTRTSLANPVVENIQCLMKIRELGEVLKGGISTNGHDLPLPLRHPDVINDMQTAKAVLRQCITLCALQAGFRSVSGRAIEVFSDIVMDLLQRVGSVASTGRNPSLEHVLPLCHLSRPADVLKGYNEHVRRYGVRLRRIHGILMAHCMSTGVQQTPSGPLLLKEDDSELLLNLGITAHLPDENLANLALLADVDMAIGDGASELSNFFDQADASGDVPLQPLSMLSQIDLLDADLIDTSDFF